MVWSHNDSWMVTGDHAGYVKYWQSNMNNVKMFQAHKEALRGIRYLQLHSVLFIFVYILVTCAINAVVISLLLSSAIHNSFLKLPYMRWNKEIPFPIFWMVRVIVLCNVAVYWIRPNLIESSVIIACTVFASNKFVWIGASRDGCQVTDQIKQTTVWADTWRATSYFSYLPSGFSRINQ